MLLSPIKQHMPQSVKQSLRRLIDFKTLYIMKTAQVHPAPIFILGHHKSGTTVIASLLAEISGQQVTLDMFNQIDRKSYWRDKLFNRQLPFSDFVQAHKFYFSTCLNKAPNLTFFYDELRQCFPKATFIFVIRDPRDTIRSILNRLGIPGNLDKLQSTEGIAWQSMIAGRNPDVIGDNYIERLANRWNLAADTYISHGEEISLIRYEDFVLDKSGAISNLASQVGLTPIHNIADKINIQYQPRSDRTISWPTFFGIDNLRRIEAICSDRMNYFGY